MDVFFEFHVGFAKSKSLALFIQDILSAADVPALKITDVLKNDQLKQLVFPKILSW